MSTRFASPRRTTLLLLAVGVAAITCVLIYLLDTRGHTVVSAVPTPTPASGPDVIVGTAQRGGLELALRVAPAELGSTRLSVGVRDQGRLVNEARIAIQLSMPAFPSLGMSQVTLTHAQDGYSGVGMFSALGRWRAVVSVHLHADAPAIVVPFDFLVGPGAGFLVLPAVEPRYGPATIAFTQAAGGDGTLRIRLKPRLQVRYVLTMPSMPDMGTAAFAMTPGRDDWYTGPIVFPMSGVSTIVVEVRDRQHWRLVRQVVFDVGSANRAELVIMSPLTH